VRAHRWRNRRRGEALLLLDDPLEKVMGYLDSGIRISVDRPFARALREVRTTHADLFAARRWVSVVLEAVEAAKRRGDICSDIGVTDIGLISGMLSDLASISPEHGPVTERIRALIHDSLRPEGMPRAALPGRPSSMQEFANDAFAARSGRPRTQSN